MDMPALAPSGPISVQPGDNDFRLLAEHLPTPCWIANGDGYIVWYNRLWHEYCGTTPQQMEGWGWQSVHDAAELPRVMEAWTRSIETGERFEMVFPLRGADGKFRPFLTRVSPMANAQGKVVRWFGVNTEIGAQLEAEAALKHSNVTAMKLLEAKELAEEATRSKSQFLATMSHEIRTPMNGILGFAELMRDTDLSETQLRYVSLMQEAGKSLLAIINDILDLSKIEAGKIDLEDISLSPVALVDGVFSILRNQIQLKPIQLEVTFDPSVPPWIMGDPTRLRQVMLNLVSNAIKFTSQGSVRITVETMVGASKNIRFSITDTGIGIPESHHKNLFLPFSQLDRSVTRTYGGTGLGLAISKRLVDAMNGKLYLDSSSSLGSTFVVELELREGDAPVTRRQSTASPEHGRPLRILVAEDIEMNRIIIEAMLEAAGHEVVTVNNGSEACKMFQTAKFDVILMDMEMPIMGGLEATMLIRKLPSVPETFPIIALTANVMKEDVARAHQFGITAHVPKPIDRGLLLALLDRHAGARHETPAQQSPSDFEIFDPEILSSLRRQLGPKTDKVVELTRTEMATCFEEMGLTKDVLLIRQRAHALVSIAGNVGLNALMKSARALMLSCDKSQDISTELADLNSLAARSFKALDSLASERRDAH